MPGLLDENLDDYAKLAVPLILARFPNWEPFAKLFPRSDGKGNGVDFTVPCPSSAAESGLWVSTADEELSVGFHTHHNHFTDYENRCNVQMIQAGIQQVADLIEERVGIVSWYRGEQFAGSRSIELPHTGRLPKMLEGLGMNAAVAGIFADCDRATLRSWHGRYDRDEVPS